MGLTSSTNPWNPWISLFFCGADLLQELLVLSLSLSLSLSSTDTESCAGHRWLHVLRIRDTCGITADSSGLFLCRFLLFLGFVCAILSVLGLVCVDSLCVWALSLALSNFSVLGFLPGPFRSRLCLCRFLVCLGPVCVDSLSAGPSEA